MTTITMEIPEQWDDLLSLARDGARRIPLELVGIRLGRICRGDDGELPGSGEAVSLGFRGARPWPGHRGQRRACLDSTGLPTAISFKPGDVVSIIVPFAGG